MSGRDSILEWITPAPSPQTGQSQAQGAEQPPVKGRVKKARTRRPVKKPESVHEEEESGTGHGRADLYVQPKARPVGVAVAWTCVGLIALGAVMGTASFLS